MEGGKRFRWMRPGAGHRRLRYLRFPKHGLFIFLMQIGLLMFAPLADTGDRLTPGGFAIDSQATAVATITLLGYRRIAIVVGLTAVVALGWAAIHVITLEGVRLPPTLVLISTYAATAYLCVLHAVIGERSGGLVRSLASEVIGPEGCEFVAELLAKAVDEARVLGR